MSRRTGRNVLFIQNNAPHTAVITYQFLVENSIRMLPHPAMSPG